MPTYALQSSNVFSYSFPNPGNTHFHCIQINNQSALNLSATNWTIECWIKPTGDYSGHNAIFTKRIGTSVSSSYQGYLGITNGVVGYYNGAVHQSSYRLTSNVWSHVAWVFNNSANLQIYVNGTRIFANTGVTSVTEVDTELLLGAVKTGNEGFKGQLSNFRIIKGQAIYTDNFNISTFPVNLPNNAIGPATGNVAGSLTGNVVLLTCKDQIIKAEGNVTHNLYANGVVTPQIVDPTELQNFSYQFYGNTGSGQNGTVLVTSTTNSLNLNADFTIETWYYPTTNTGVLLERGYAGVGNNNASYILIWDTPNNNINFAVANANNAAYSVGALTGAAGSLGAPTLNAWNHIAVTRAGNTYRGFLNGALTFTPATNANTPYAALGRGLTIGGMFNNGQTYATGIPANTISGHISNLRIIRGNSIYNAAFTVSNTSQLLNLTNVILLTGMSPAFEDLSGNHTLAQNGMNQITFSTNSPIRANSQINANATVGFSTNYSIGLRSKVDNKFNYQNFGQMINIYATVGQRQTRIRDKFDVEKFAFTLPFSVYTLGQRQRQISDKFDCGKFAFSTPVNIYTVGQKGGRTYAKQLTRSDFAYLPFGSSANNAASANIEYQFWS